MPAVYDRRRPLVALTIAALALGLAGCGSSAADSEAPKPPARPRELAFDNVKPCALLSQPQQGEFGVDQPAEDGTSPTFNAPSCVYISQKEKVSLSVVLVTDRGIAEFAPGKATGQTDAVTVAGFPGYRVRTDQPAGEQFCTVHLDAAPDRVLTAAYNEEGRDKPLSKDEVCQRATKVAEAALGTLTSAK
ncbi:DUF3558 domain-containing protein [Crossiella cryophila]|uniref:DUF3558 domain-containing protein n=1 Tax=Crossiella cryophila TaxID=43355 RepID=A0A7W7FSP3_9PSEU|nr:DUF3558 domain-containing protein [Crossiella cryophila]MBB4676175.1 hypothetical protein [Crossiella cryophila]